MNKRLSSRLKLCLVEGGLHVESLFYLAGPPQPANLSVTGITGQQRKDISAVLTAPDVIQGKTASKPHALRPQEVCSSVPGSITPDDRYPAHRRCLQYQRHLSIVMSRPDTGNLDATVDYIIRETLAFVVLGIRLIYCLRRSSHSSKTCGLSIASGSSVATTWILGAFPCRLGVYFSCASAIWRARLHGTDTSAFTQSQVRLQTGLTKWVMLRNSHLKMEALQGRVTDGQTFAPLKRMLDVWFLRGPKNDSIVRTALETYVTGWFEIQRWAKTVEKRKAEVVGARQLRELVVTSLLTGLSYHNGRTRSKQESESCLLRVSQNGLPEFGVRKVHFRSHRD